MVLLVVLHLCDDYIHYEFVVERFDIENIKEQMLELIDEFKSNSRFSITYI
jgi:hypothetical protein